MLRRLVERSGRPMAITILQRDNKPEEWRRLTGRIAEARRRRPADDGPGADAARPASCSGFEISQNPFVSRPSWKEIAGSAVRAVHRACAQPEFRARLISRDDPG